MYFVNSKKNSTFAHFLYHGYCVVLVGIAIPMVE